MKRWIKWTAGIVVALVAALALVAAAGWQLAERKMTRKVDVTVAPVAYAAQPQALERGKYLFQSRGCADCHGADGAGRIFVNEANGLRLGGPDITAAGSTRNYQPQDWVRTIRHGVKPAGQPVMIMPSEDYNRFTDPDLAALVAYVRALPPAKGAPAVLEMPPPVRILYGLGAIKDAAAKIDHSLPPAQPVPGRSRCETWRVCGQHVHRLPWPATVGRQDSRRPARLAGRGQPDAGRGQRDDALQGRGGIHGDAAQRQAAGRQRDQGDAIRVAGQARTTWTCRRCTSSSRPSRRGRRAGVERTMARAATSRKAGPC